ncbi:hypothetical protein [Cryobacterium sp. GrIS_2_6]|uniref:hypothetical protein n=1 Tax=Cryobacterium sp. GrIS_2_6 TaxID=3162785 RepID=UPI002E02CBE1|nr:hypothetical protein [Cryobacterium psychrotolerans]
MSTLHPDQTTPLAAYPAPPAYAPAAPVRPASPLALTSLGLGLVSILAGWTFVAPIVGLITGVLALGREPYARAMALWGIVLNAVMLAGVFLLLVLGLIFGLAFLPFALAF